MKFGIEFGSEENTERDDVKPKEKRDACAERAIDLGVVSEAGNVPTKGDSSWKPHHGGENGTGKNPLPGLFHGRSHVIDQADDACASRKRDHPTDEKSNGVDGSAGGGHDVDCQPFRNELSEDYKCAGKNEGDQRERDEEKGPEAALQKGPAVHGEIVGAANTFHQRREDAGRSDEADQKSDDEGVGGAGAVGRVDEVALQQRADVRRENAIEEGR